MNTVNQVAGLPEWLGRHPRAALLLALVAGLSLVLAFAPFAWRTLSIVAPATLFILWVRAEPRAAAWRGYAFGVGFFGAGVYWIYYSLYLFGEAIAPLAALITAGFVLFLALFPALLGYLLALLGRRLALTSQLLLLMPASWVAFEAFRSVFLTGFPWLLLGSAHVDTALAGYAPVVGVFGVSLMVALMAGVLAWGLLSQRRRGWQAAALLLFIWVLGAGLQQVNWTQPMGAPVTVALLQGNVAQAEKLQPWQLPQSIQVYYDLTQQALGAELVIWPETAVPTFYREIRDELLWPLADQVHAAGGALIAGVFTYDDATAKLHNSIVHVDRQQSSFYHKRRLVPFGEYLPLRKALHWLDRWMDLPMADLSPGTGDRVLQVGDWVLGPSVCYEGAYAGLVRLALPQAHLLVNVSNDAWFGDSIAPHQHLQIARMRSVESGRDMLRATNTGISAVIDYRGRLSAVSPQFEPHVLRTSAQPRQGTTPYVRWGDAPLISLLGLMVGLALLSARRGPRAKA